MSESAQLKDVERTLWNGIAGRLREGLPVDIFDVTAFAAPALLERLAPGPGARVLDVACGPARWYGAPAAQGLALVGLDLSQGMVAEAARRHPSALFVLGDAEALPFPEASFDRALCNFAVMHFPDPPAALAEARRVLRPGGRYAFTTWAPPASSRLFGSIVEAIMEHAVASSGLPRAHPTWLYSDPEEATQVLAGAGFTDIEVREIPLRIDLARPEDVVHVVRTTGYTRATLEAQPPDVQERILKLIVERVSGEHAGGSLRLEIPAVAAVGRT